MGLSLSLDLPTPSAFEPLLVLIDFGASCCDAGALSSILPCCPVPSRRSLFAFTDVHAMQCRSDSLTVASGDPLNHKLVHCKLSRRFSSCSKAVSIHTSLRPVGPSD